LIRGKRRGGAAPSLEGREEALFLNAQKEGGWGKGGKKTHRPAETDIPTKLKEKGKKFPSAKKRKKQKPGLNFSGGGV